MEADTSGEHAKRKRPHARLSIVSNTIFVTAKLAVGIISGAIHSIIGFIAAIIAGLSVRRSARPTSAAPPGTEKCEDTSGQP